MIIDYMINTLTNPTMSDWDLDMEECRQVAERLKELKYEREYAAQAPYATSLEKLDPGLVMCTNCHHTFRPWHTEGWNYCPECGYTVN